MRWYTWLVTVFVSLAILLALMPTPSHASRSTHADDGLRALDGEWIYVEDRTEGRTLEQLGPPMSSKFTFRIEDDAVILVWGHGGGRGNVRVAIDGSITEVQAKDNSEVARYRAQWKDATLSYEIDFIRKPGDEPQGLIRREFRMSPDGLLVSASRPQSQGLYRHAEDIPMPTPAKATIADLAWLAGAWTGTRGSQGQISFEERWSPPLGGSMLATSRTVSRGKLSAFEYLRVIERDDGLVYIAQPNGGSPTEFVLTELTATRAVFDNPRHDYPKRITYELSPEGALTATIGFTKGGAPRRFEFKPEAR
ncbi:MAG: DUF6265 family protein [Phycisphaerales bacterium]